MVIASGPSMQKNHSVNLCFRHLCIRVWYLSFLLAFPVKVFSSDHIRFADDGYNTPLSTPYLMSKREYLELLVGNYVHGFKEFGTAIYILPDPSDVLYVDIYYDVNRQKKLQAMKFQRHLAKELPYVLARYEWAKDIPIEINIFQK